MEIDELRERLNKAAKNIRNEAKEHNTPIIYYMKDVGRSKKCQTELCFYLMKQLAHICWRRLLNMEWIPNPKAEGQKNTYEVWQPSTSDDYKWELIGGMPFSTNPTQRDRLLLCLTASAGLSGFLICYR